MTASKPAMRRSSARLVGKTDLAKVDAHVIQPHEYDEIPELTDAFFERAEFRIGGELVSRARPRFEGPDTLVSLLIDREALDAFRATGPDWQARMNEVLVEAAKRLPKG